MPAFDGEPEPVEQHPPAGDQPPAREEVPAPETGPAASGAEHGDDLVQQGGTHVVDEAGLAEAAAELDAVEAALGRLEDGSFDTCEVCGAPIGRDRLLHDPLLTRCPQHASTRPDGPAGAPQA